MIEKEFLKKYGCNSLSEFIDVYLDFDLAFKIMKEYFILQEIKQASCDFINDIDCLNKKIKMIHGYLLLRQSELEEYKKCNFNKDGYYNVKIDDFIDYILGVIV
ncbi:MAG: hypothetical protein PHG18_05165 [Bacilli bacterium]|nr:hypothetical protein [Bacilli bacterium]